MHLGRSEGLGEKKPNETGLNNPEGCRHVEYREDIMGHSMDGVRNYGKGGLEKPSIPDHNATQQWPDTDTCQRETDND